MKEYNQEKLQQTEEKVNWKCIIRNIRGWGGKQDGIKKKMEKIKSEIEGYHIVILTETHLDTNEEEIKKMGKYLQEYNIYNTHDKHKPAARNGVTICVKKKITEIENIEIRTDKGEKEEGRWIRLRIKKALDKVINI